MTPTQEFRAPWGRSLRLLTIFSAALLAAMPIIGFALGPNESSTWLIVMIAFPPLILLAAAFFIVRGYRLTDDCLIIQRPGWQTTLSLNRLDTVTVDPQAMLRSLRLFGNGGLFCFAGWFRNRRLGRYRAFATDPRLAVVLRFADRTIVVTPDQPQQFVDFIERERRL